MLETVHRPAEGEAHPVPLLFVHGAWHGAWCWDEHFLPAAAARGFDATALSLPGHAGSDDGRSLRWLGMGDYVAAVREVAESLPADPLVIGHSMGGYVVQHYLGRGHRAAGGALLAAAPPWGIVRTTLSVASHHPLRFLQSNATLSLYPLVNTPALARSHFFSASMEDAEVERHASRLGDESYRAFLEMVGLNRPRTSGVEVPMLVLGARRDTIFSVAEVEGTAGRFGVEAELFDMAHDMMLEPGWEVVLDRVLGFAAGLRDENPAGRE